MQPPLFPQEDQLRQQWAGAPCAAFAHWIAHVHKVNGRFGYDSLSREQYQAMWDKFIRHLETVGLSLLRLSPQALTDFLRTLPGRTGDGAAASTRRRYLALVDGVFTHLVQQGVVPDNPATPLKLQPEFQARERPSPAALFWSMSERYREHVLGLTPATWKDQRDQVLMLLPLASGLTTREIAGLKLQDVRPDERPPMIAVAAYRRTPAHAAPIAPWALPILQRWARMRTGLALPGDVYLPATSAGAPLEDSVIYRKIAQALAPLAFDCPEKGPRSLRHSFALRQLQHGIPPAEVSRMLGLTTSHTVDRLLALLPPPSAESVV